MDLRDFLDKLASEGELRRVGAQVDCELEVGAISRRGMDLRAPAMLFENLQGYPKGMRLAANFMGPTRPVPQGRLAIALGMPKETPTLELIREMQQRLRRRIPPQRVDRRDAPCKEVVLTGDDVDLTKFPAPLIHGTDGGRYIGTWHVDVTRDRDSGSVNWGLYRHMVLDAKRLGWWAAPAQHGMSHFLQQYVPHGEPMPIAIAIGTEPIATIVAGTQMPPGVWEAEVAGGVQGEPMKLVACETVDLEVPASSEIVIEGWVHPGEFAPEGNFGEYTGYAAGERRNRPAIRVSCITHRRDPILTMTNLGKPWDEDHVMMSIVLSAQIANELEDRGMPFKSIYCPPPALCVFVAVDPPYAGFAHVLSSAIWSLKAGIYRPYIFVFGGDVDVTNPDDVIWCLTTRLHPANGIHVQRQTPASQLFPFLSKDERDRFESAKVLFDATFPKSWAPEDVPAIISFENAWPAEVQQRVLARWHEYGF